jgi:DNA-binding beta-propeller fold protein YncE
VNFDGSRPAGRGRFSRFLAVPGLGLAFELTHARVRVPSVVHCTRRRGVCLLLGFVLVASCRLHNRPDAPAEPVGPDSVEVDSAYTFESWVADSESGQAYIRFDWGDGDTSSWCGPGDTAECLHSWNQDGVFRVRAQARDDRTELSEWSVPCNVTSVTPPYPYRLVDSVTIINAPLLDAQVLPNGEFVYVTNDWSGALSAVRTSDLQLVAQIPFNEGWSSSGQVVCSPDGRYAYATCYRDDWVAVIRAADHVVVDSLVVGDGSYVTSVAMAPDGQRLYMAVTGDSSFIEVVRLPDWVSEDTIWLPWCDEEITSLRVAPDGTRLYLTGADWDDLYAIRLSDNAVCWRATNCGYFAWQNGIIVHPSGSPLYVVENPYIAVRDPSTGGLIDSIRLPAEAQSVDISSDGSYLYAAGGRDDSGSVAVVRTSDNMLARVVALPAFACDAARSPDGQRLYVTDGRGKLYVIGRWTRGRELQGSSELRFAAGWPVRL